MPGQEPCPGYLCSKRTRHHLQLRACLQEEANEASPHLRRTQLLSQVSGRRNETETNGGGGSFPSPAQLREPATPPLDMPSPPQTPALAPLEDSLFLWGGSGDGRDSAIPGTQTNKRARTAKGGMEGRGTSKARGALRKGSFYTRLPLPPACSPSSRDQCGLCRTPARLCTGRRIRRSPPRGPHLREPRPRSSPPAGTPGWAALLPTASAEPRRPRRGGPAPSPARWARIPGTLALLSADKAGLGARGVPVPGIPLGGAVHPAASAPGPGSAHPGSNFSSSAGGQAGVSISSVSPVAAAAPNTHSP